MNRTRININLQNIEFISELEENSFNFTEFEEISFPGLIFHELRERFEKSKYFTWIGKNHLMQINSFQYNNNNNGNNNNSNNNYNNSTTSKIFHFNFSEERSYHIFYQLLSGLNQEEREELGLFSSNPLDYNYLTFNKLY